MVSSIQRSRRVIARPLTAAAIWSPLFLDDAWGKDMHVALSALILVAAMAALTGCQQKSSSTESATSAAAPDVTPSGETLPTRLRRLSTAEDWKRALEASYVEEFSAKDEGDGITSSVAYCFGAESRPDDLKECGDLMFVERDAFRRVRFFTPLNSKLYSALGDRYVFSYIALVDCGLPKYVLRPHYFSKHDWLFLNRVTIMAEGEVVLDRDLSKLKARRDAESWGVDETVEFVATDEDLAALRRVAVASKVLIRLTGEKGYVATPPDYLARFSDDVRNALVAYDKLTAALKDYVPPSCP
jgi:hypothetical protein